MLRSICRYGLHLVTEVGIVTVSWPRGAALTARDEDWQDLLDEIRRAEAMLDDTRPPGWSREPEPPA